MLIMQYRGNNNIKNNSTLYRVIEIISLCRNFNLVQVFICFNNLININFFYVKSSIQKYICTFVFTYYYVFLLLCIYSSNQSIDDITIAILCHSHFEQLFRHFYML